MRITLRISTLLLFACFIGHDKCTKAETEDCGYFSSSCEQSCIMFEGEIQCSCFPGYHPIEGSDGRLCGNDAWYETAVLYATENEIKSLNASTKVSTVVQSRVLDCTALTAANNYVYYATLLPGNKGGIFKSALSSATPTKIMETDFPVTSIAVDYVTNNIYFTSNGLLSVCTNNGSICTELKSGGINQVTLAPKVRLMFYTQLLSQNQDQSSLIMKSNMDGSNEKEFGNDAISIVADELKSMLYSLKIFNKYYSTYKIDLIPFDVGTNLTAVVLKSVRCLGVLDGEVFGILDVGNNIYHYGKDRKIQIHFSDKHASSLKQLYVYNSLLQRSNQNPCDKSSCSGICLIKPLQSSSSASDYTCVQSNGFFRIMTYILVLVFLAALGVSGYYVGSQRNWYQYFMSILSRQRSTRTQRVDTNEL